MEWSDIRVFLQVARDGSMVAATNRLRLDHSTISRRISRLERQAGVLLFERAGRRLSLTAEGQKLRLSAEKLESIIVKEVQSLAAEQDSIAGVVRIGTTEDFGAYYLAPRLSELTAAHPNLEIELVVSARPFSLAAREVDIVISHHRPLAGDVRFRKLTDLECGVFGSAEYFSARTRPAAIDDLFREVWCGHIGEFAAPPERQNPVLTPEAIHYKYKTVNASVQLGAAAGGHALVILPCFVASENPGLERLLPGEVSIERTYWLAVHEDLASYARVRALVNALATQVARDRALFRPSAETASNARRPGTRNQQDSAQPDRMTALGTS